MNRDALGPVAVFSLVVVVLTSIVATTLEQSTDIPLLYTEAVSNGGLAVVLVAVLLLFEWLSYTIYRRKGPTRILADGVFVFVAGTAVTVLVVGAFGAVGLSDLAPELGGLVVDVDSLLGGLAAFGAAVYLFYARNRDCYRPRRSRRGN